MSQQIDKRIVEKIQELVGERIRNIQEIERAINVFVKNDIFKGKSLPPQTSLRFFPERIDLRNHMYRASVKLRFSKIDQENLFDFVSRITKFLLQVSTVFYILKRENRTYF